MQFKDLHLIDPLLRAVQAEGYTTPTPIQQQAIPHVLAGRDLLGCAQTGTGKTAAFALPILQRLTQQERRSRGVRVLVLSPTRELATQIKDSFEAYGRHTPLRSTVIFGGVGQGPQVEALRRGVDVLVAAPGRLLDLMGQGLVRLDTVEIVVLDEADRMLDMGFIRDVRRILGTLPKQRQTLLFSATMPLDIQKLAADFLVDPVYVEVTPQATTVEKIAQSVYFVEKNEKRDLLEHLLEDRTIQKVLVFTRTKHGADKVVKQLDKALVRSEAIHGNKSQNARERALSNFHSGAIRVLVATDIAARGIDVDGITHVINYDLPNIPESYVHRIGRTARAGASGIAISFCDEEERKFLSDIEKTIRMRVPVVSDHPYVSPIPFATNGAASRNGSAGANRSTNGSQNGGQRRPSTSSNGTSSGQGQHTDGRSQPQAQAQPKASAEHAQARPSPAAGEDGAVSSAAKRRRRRRRKPSNVTRTPQV